MNHHKDYYEILGIEELAPPEKVKEAYRRLAFQYHPDKNPGDAGAVERMKEINEAYAVLSEPEKREAYDRVRSQFGSSAAHDRFRQSYSEQDIFRGSDVNQIFEEMARAFGFRGFEDVFRNTYGQGYRTFEFARPGMFGKFIIFGSPQGGGSGRRLGGGAPGLLGKAASYLLGRVFGSLQGPVPGRDIHDSLSLDPAQASAGGKVRYGGIKGHREIMITIPPGIKEGQTIRLRGLGAPGANGAAAGDLYLKVEMRKPLLQRVREMLKV